VIRQHRLILNSELAFSELWIYSRQKYVAGTLSNRFRHRPLSGLEARHYVLRIHFNLGKVARQRLRET